MEHHSTLGVLVRNSIIAIELLVLLALSSYLIVAVTYYMVSEHDARGSFLIFICGLSAFIIFMHSAERHRRRLLRWAGMHLLAVAIPLVVLRGLQMHFLPSLPEGTWIFFGFLFGGLQWFLAFAFFHAPPLSTPPGQHLRGPELISFEEAKGKAADLTRGTQLPKKKP